MAEKVTPTPVKEKDIPKGQQPGQISPITPGREIMENQHEMDELRAFLARFKSDAFLGVNGGKKDRKYMWVNTHPRIVARHKELGFVPCTDPDIVVWDQGGVDAVKPDGTKVVGDLLLMEMPMARWEMFEVLREERRREQLGAEGNIRRQFHSEAERIGVSTFEDTGHPETGQRGKGWKE